MAFGTDQHDFSLNIWNSKVILKIEFNIFNAITDLFTERMSSVDEIIKYLVELLDPNNLASGSGNTPKE